MLGPKFFISNAWKELEMLKEEASDFINSDDDDENSLFQESMWQLKYGFPKIVLLIGDKNSTSALITSLKETIKADGYKMDFNNMSMQELVLNNNKPISSPISRDGGYLLVEYKSGLTDLSVYDLTSHILMIKNNGEESVFEGLQEDQNWRGEEFHKENKHIMPWIRSGWNLIVVADESYYNPVLDCSKGFGEKIYKDLSDNNKWEEIRTFEPDN